MRSTQVLPISRETFIVNARETGHVGIYFTPKGDATRDWLIIKNCRCHPAQVLTPDEIEQMYANTTHEIHRLINASRVFKMEVRELMEYGPNGFSVPYREEGYSREELAAMQQLYTKTHTHLHSASLSGLHRVLDPYRKKTVVIAPGGAALSGFFKTVKEKEQSGS